MTDLRESSNSSNLKSKDLTGQHFADILIQRPKGQAVQLILLCHGYGANAQDLQPLGQALANFFTQACVVSLQAPEVGEYAMGWQWFSLKDIQEGLGSNSRAQRINEVLPAFEQRVQEWQRQTGVKANATVLLGFSQGATMALEMAHQSKTTAVGRVVALSGRFAQLPTQAIEGLTIHLVHGKADEVIPYGFCVEGAKHLVSLGADLTADVLPYVGHEINEQVEQLVIERLTTYVPKHIWDEALRVASQQSVD